MLQLNFEKEFSFLKCVWKMVVQVNDVISLYKLDGVYMYGRWITQQLPDWFNLNFAQRLLIYQGINVELLKSGSC